MGHVFNITHSPGVHFRHAGRPYAEQIRWRSQGLYTILLKHCAYLVHTILHCATCRASARTPAATTAAPLLGEDLCVASYTQQAPSNRSPYSVTVAPHKPYAPHTATKAPLRASNQILLITSYASLKCICLEPTGYGGCSNVMSNCTRTVRSPLQQAEIKTHSDTKALNIWS
jgi:hypothetical protein